MSLRGSLTLECDRKTCHAEIVLESEDAAIVETQDGLRLDFSAHGWHMDDQGDVWCPDCSHHDDRDEAYERAAARDRLDGFARTGGKDWT